MVEAGFAEGSMYKLNAIFYLISCIHDFIKSLSHIWQSNLIKRRGDNNENVEAKQTRRFFENNISLRVFTTLAEKPFLAELDRNFRIFDGNH